MLPGQKKLDEGIPLETDGYRIGFPKDTHCDPDRRDGRSFLINEESFKGMKCCNMDLFQSMHNSILDMKEEDTFHSIDRRFIAQAGQ